MAGVSVSAWRRPRVDWIAPSTPSCPPMAQPTWAVDVVIPRISISALAPARGVSTPARASARSAHVGADRPEGHVAVVVAGAEGEPDLEEVVGQHREDRVAPLDEHHAAFVEHLGQPEVEGLAQLLEPVHVEVVHGEAALVDVDEGEGGARDAIGDAEARGRSPGRRPSCRRRGRRPARSRRRVGPATTPRRPGRASRRRRWWWRPRSRRSSLGASVAALDPCAERAHHLVGDGAEAGGPLVRRDPLRRPARRAARPRRPPARRCRGRRRRAPGPS